MGERVLATMGSRWQTYSLQEEGVRSFNQCVNGRELGESADEWCTLRSKVKHFTKVRVYSRRTKKWAESTQKHWNAQIYTFKIRFFTVCRFYTWIHSVVGSRIISEKDVSGIIVFMFNCIDCIFIVINVSPIISFLSAVSFFLILSFSILSKLSCLHEELRFRHQKPFTLCLLNTSQGHAISTVRFLSIHCTSITFHLNYA